MVKRIKKRTRIAKTRPISPRSVEPVEPLDEAYFEPPEAAYCEPAAEQAARGATPREIVAEQLRQRREGVARAMAEAQAKVTAAVERAALDLPHPPVRELAVPLGSPRPADPAIETAAQAAIEAMHAATRAVEAAGQGAEATASFLDAEATAVDQVLVEAMHAADRSVAASVHAAEAAIAAAAGVTDGEGR